MTTPANTLPDEISQLKTIIAEQILNINKYEKEVHFYREEVSHREEKITHQQEDIARKDAEIERLEEIVRLFKHHRFGRKSEVVRRDENQLELGIFNEAEDQEEKSLMQEPLVGVKGYRRRGKPKRVKLPPELPREDVIIDLKEEEKVCPEGHELKCIDEDISEKLDVIPAQVKVIRTIRKKYACLHCEGHVKRAPLPKTAIPKSIAAPGLLAYIATSKYGDGLPLYRQEHMWQRIGVEIPRATMAAWMIKVGELFTPLINLMEEELLESGYVQADETRVQVLKEPGKRPESRSYMWVRGRSYPGAPPIILFEYDPTRSGEVARRLFTDYKGYLQADAYVGYDGICGEEGVERLGCMAHCRRKFFEATKASKRGLGLANEVIEVIGELYKVEESIKDKSIEERHQIRNKESKPILDKFRKLIDENIGKVPPKSQLGMALSYAHNEWPYLTRYLDDGRLSIDNNIVENAIRPFAVGRKNWLFSDSVAGAKASAAIYSVMVSARLNGHNEYAYFRHILEKLPLVEKIEDLEVLLPHRRPLQDTHLTENRPKLKKFKLSESFRPLAVEEDDELFANGIFEFNVTKLLAFIMSNPDKFAPEEVDIKTLSRSSSDGLDESAVQTANLSTPLILVEISPGRFNVIDGNHRLERAYRDKVEKLPVFKVYADQHLTFLTSSKAYKLYIDYWNSKIDDAILC